MTRASPSTRPAVRGRTSALRRQSRPTHRRSAHAAPPRQALRPGADLGCELPLQQEIHRAALEIAETARGDLAALARRSRRIAGRVCCDQEEWPAIIADYFDDMLGDTFDCLPDAIARARRAGIGRDE